MRRGSGCRDDRTTKLSDVRRKRRRERKMEVQMPNKCHAESGAHVRWSALLGRYRQSVRALEKVKAENFYHGTPVEVNHPRYKGPGIAVTDGDCWPDHVAVSLPNGNTWRYPLESVRPNEQGEPQPPDRKL